MGSTQQLGWPRCGTCRWCPKQEDPLTPGRSACFSSYHRSAEYSNPTVMSFTIIWKYAMCTRRILIGCKQQTVDGMVTFPALPSRQHPRRSLFRDSPVSRGIILILIKRPEGRCVSCLVVLVDSNLLLVNGHPTLTNYEHYGGAKSCLFHII